MNQIACLSTEDWWRAMSREYLRQRAIERIKLQPFFRSAIAVRVKSDKGPWQSFVKQIAFHKIRNQPFFQPNPYEGAKWTAFDIGRFEGDKSVAVEFNRLESGAVRVMRIDEWA